MVRRFATRIAGRGFALGLLGATLALPAGAAGLCARAPEVSAVQTRLMQTDLMVAALTCGEHARYNAFVGKHRAELARHGRALKAYFHRAHGTAAQKSLDSFITRLANEASLRTIDARADYCTRAGAVLAEVLDATPAGGLAALAAEQPYARASGIAACPATDQQQASAER